MSETLPLLLLVASIFERGGNIREVSLAAILESTPELNLNSGQAARHLWCFCASCEYSELCRGGCSWTAHVFFRRRGNNPYCSHRSAEKARRGLRERLVQIGRAPGGPFDHGAFEAIEEPAESPWPSEDGYRFKADQIQWSAPREMAALHVIS